MGPVDAATYNGNDYLVFSAISIHVKEAWQAGYWLVNFFLIFFNSVKCTFITESTY